MIPVLRVTLTIFLQLIICHSEVSPFKVVLSPKRPLFRVGDRQELTCRVSECSGEVTFSWSSLKDTPLYADIQHSTSSSTLLFKYVNKKHENIIRCTATCKGTRGEAAATVKVYSFANNPVISGHNSLESGKENTLTCEVSDFYPAGCMTLEWVRGGEVVQTEDGDYDKESIQSHYEFTPNITNNGESITCRATLSLEGLPQTESTRETTESMTVLSFAKDPVISGHNSLESGKENTLTCEVSDVNSAERMTLEWVRGGVVVQTENGEYGKESIQSYYKFTPNITNNGESITCRATLSLEGLPQTESTRETTESMTVLCPPVNTVISVSPNNPKEMEFLNISCVSDSSPVGHMVLSKVLDGKETELVSGDGPQVSVSYREANVSHSGFYICTTTTSCSRKTDNITITVTAHPVEVSLRPDKILIPVQRGSSMELTCISSACPHPRITWPNVKHQPRLSRSDNQTVESQLGPWIVGLEDNQTFICEVECGSVVKSKRTELRVFSFAKDPVISGHNNLESGAKSILTCEVSDVYPAERMTLKWVRGGVVVQTENGEYGKGSIQSHYEFTPNITNNNESITCRATLGLEGLPPTESTRNTTVSMTVLSFSTDPTIESSGTFLEGQVTNLTCTVVQVFPVGSFHMQWLDGQQKLNSVRGNFSDKLQNLSLTVPLKPKDTDRNKTFTCVVSLEMKGLSRKKTVSTTKTVQYSPKFTTIDVRPHKKPSEGETVTISCQTDSSPEGHVTLKRVLNGEETKLVSSNGTQTSFNISFTTLSHSGNYVCEAVNKYGHQRKDVQITVQTPPRNITVAVLPSKEVQEGENITISCQSVSFPPSNITLRKLNNGNEIYSSNGTFQLVNLTSNDTGLYQVIATNVVGSETENFTLNVMSKRKNHKEIYKAMFEKLTSTDFIIPAIGVGVLAMVISSLGLIRKAKMKGAYELSEIKAELP